MSGQGSHSAPRPRGHPVCRSSELSRHEHKLCQQPGTSVGLSGTQRHKAGCLRPQMGCGGFHGSAHPAAEAPLPALVHSQPASPAGSRAHPTSNHPPSFQAFADSAPASSLLPTMLLVKSSGTSGTRRFPSLQLLEEPPAHSPHTYVPPEGQPGRPC